MGQKWNSLSFMVLLALTLAGCATLLEPTESRRHNPRTSESWRTQERARRAPSEKEELDVSAAAPSSVRPGDIALGMTRGEVLRNWGDPIDMQAAGNSRSGNEKWTYSEASTSYWHGRYERVVYFENGRVVGWQTR